MSAGILSISEFQASEPVSGVSKPGYFALMKSTTRGDEYTICDKNRAAEGERMANGASAFVSETSFWHFAIIPWFVEMREYACPSFPSKKCSPSTVMTRSCGKVSILFRRDSLTMTSLTFYAAKNSSVVDLIPSKRVYVRRRQHHSDYSGSCHQQYQINYRLGRVTWLLWPWFDLAPGMEERVVERGGVTRPRGGAKERRHSVTLCEWKMMFRNFRLRPGLGRGTPKNRRPCHDMWYDTSSSR